MLTYPDFDRSFILHTDASDYHMGGVISQEHGDPPVLKPKTFWSQKLSAVQRNYPVIDKRMLSIVELLKEYRVTLLGHKIKIYADHKNLTYDGTIFQSDQLL